MRSKIHKDLFQDRQNKMLGNENMLQTYIQFFKNLKQVFFKQLLEYYYGVHHWTLIPIIHSLDERKHADWFMEKCI